MFQSIKVIRLDIHVLLYIIYFYGDLAYTLNPLFALSPFLSNTGDNAPRLDGLLALESTTNIMCSIVSLSFLATIPLSQPLLAHHVLLVLEGTQLQQLQQLRLIRRVLQKTSKQQNLALQFQNAHPRHHRLSIRQIQLLPRQF